MKSNIVKNDIIKLIGGFVGEVIAGYKRSINVEYDKTANHHIMMADCEVLMPSDDGHETYSFHKDGWDTVIDNDNVIILKRKKASSSNVIGDGE